MVPPKLTLVPNASRERDGDVEDHKSSKVSTGAAEPVAYGDPEATGGDVVPSQRRNMLRRLEAQLFASAEPLDVKELSRHLAPGADAEALLLELQSDYRLRGVNLIRTAGKWQFRTAADLSFMLERQQTAERKLSKAALETLAIVAYHQPVTRAEIEDVRGVTISGGTLDVLMEAGWIRPRGRRRAPGRPITYGTTEQFLLHFGLDTVRDLPGMAELKGAGLLDGQLPPDFSVPEPQAIAALMPDELPLEDGDETAPDELPLHGDDDDDKPKPERFPL